MTQHGHCSSPNCSCGGASVCNCPPLRDVFREGVGTKPSCPVHGESDVERACPEPGGCDSCPDPAYCRGLRIDNGVTTEEQEAAQ